ncbi:serine/arginine-rich splicing factor RS41-like isoform X2 [Chenopodium quinoa]|uniref:RRM domain-containing protein n=2 Tax=Chenopodium quinoa TaxID=63459 RepID=A0A803M0I7_CHEQI|nr:serine/arginine-rich splicing factor RS41-like isoform X2 [Chenopodium quinoa]XP_021765181.1 serine/arginine-rich splicing factor RS41-like isoform X2 [Chenopodium quinoa]
MDDDRDAEYAIRALDRSEFGRKGRRLRVEWTKHERGGRKPVSTRRSANLRPSKTLFVINFPYDTKTRDLERHFDPYGKIVNVRIRRNFAFVQYESQDDATKALDATNLSKLMDRVISVEYAARDDDERRGGSSPDRRGRDRSPSRRRRSPSPYKRERGSPDYGTGSSPAAYRRERGSPEYGNGSSRSPRRVQRSPEYGNRLSRSPRRVQRSPEYGNGMNRSPRQASRSSPHYSRARSSSPRPEEKLSDFRERSRSPRGEKNGHGHGHGRPLSSSPYPEEGAISDDAQEPRSPINKPFLRESPTGEYGSPVDDRYRSPSPLARERSQS